MASCPPAKRPRTGLAPTDTIVGSASSFPSSSSSSSSGQQHSPHRAALSPHSSPLQSTVPQSSSLHANSLHSHHHHSHHVIRDSPVSSTGEASSSSSAMIGNYHQGSGDLKDHLEEGQEENPTAPSTPVVTTTSSSSSSSCETTSSTKPLHHSSSSYSSPHNHQQEQDYDAYSSSSSSMGSPPALDSPTEDSYWSRWIEEQKLAGISPLTWLARFGIQTSLLLSSPQTSPPGSPSSSNPSSSPFSQDRLWSLAVHCLRAALNGPRRRLSTFNTLDHVVDAISKAKNILVLSGAGLSVSSGIPDFRSEQSGVYARIQEEFGLSEPQEMFDMECFVDDPKPFFTFAAEIFPGRFTPSPGHAFIRALADRGKLLRNYTQNIDTLEQVAGIPENLLVQCHGSFATATCLLCRNIVPGDDIKDDIFARTVPYCKICPPGTPGAVLKPDIVFFGEQLPSKFRRTFAEDKEKADLLLVIGSSLKVSPVSQVPLSLPNHVPQILINREVVGRPSEFDVELLGDADDIVAELTHLLNWSLPPVSPPPPSPSPYSYSSPNRYLFRNARPPLHSASSSPSSSSPSSPRIASEAAS